ncbi:MAG TPA: hypothetical protein VH539_21745 [Gemmatimonadaceae bacterium]
MLSLLETDPEHLTPEARAELAEESEWRSLRLGDPVRGVPILDGRRNWSFRLRAFVPIALAAIAFRAEAQASDSLRAALDHWAIGISLGLPAYRRQVVPEFTTVAISFTQFRPERLGADIAIGTVPRLDQSSLGALGGRAGVTFPLAPVKHLLILPSAGVSAIAMASPGGAGGAAGFNGCLATVLYAGDVGLRTGITVNSLHGFGAPVWLLEVGFVAIGTNVN